MGEELLQRDLINNPEKIGTWNFYNIGATSINALKKAGIIRSIDYGAVGKKKVDALITKQKEVIAIIEYKAPKSFNTQAKKKKAVLQGLSVAKKLHAKLIIATDTQETLWVNPATGNRVKDSKGNDFNYSFEPKDPNLQKVIEEVTVSIHHKNDRILSKKLVDPTALAKQVWQDVWSVSGATPENCLYTFVELFVFKYLSDLKILQGSHNFYKLLDSYNHDDADTVLKTYANSIRPKIKELFPQNDIDKTTIINGTIFVSKNQTAIKGYSRVFKKVLERFRDYGKLEHIDHDFKSKLFESFLKESISKKNWGQFFTPIKVVRSINKMAKMDAKELEGKVICDPACGVGKFLLEFIKESIGTLFPIEHGTINPKIKILGFDKGFDKDEQKTIILAKANMLIYFCELIKENAGSTKAFAQLFNQSFILKTNSILGTLVAPTKEAYDLILTNPPYVTSGSSNLKEEILKNTTLKNHYKINAIGVEGLFMEWIIKALKKGGKAFIVVPDGIFNRQNDKKLRQYILDTCYLDAIISLPPKTFFSTPKKTYILAITKKRDVSMVQTEPVFTYLCSEIGESRDVYRFAIPQDDLSEAVALFNSFKGNKRGFQKLNQDKRCKVQSIERFTGNVNSSWIIDEDWTKKEKIKLGIEEEEKTVTMQEFSLLLGEIADEIKYYANLIAENSNMKKAEVNYIDITNTDYFDLKRGKRITKKTINANKGTIPVFSSSKKAENILGYISKDFLQNNKLILYSRPSILFNLDGSVGHCFIRNEKEYSFIDVVASLRPLKSNIDLEYVLYKLKHAISKTGANYNTKLYFNKIRQYKIAIPFPLEKDGNIDLEKQKEIAEKYRIIEANNRNIKKELDIVTALKIDI